MEKEELQNLSPEDQATIDKKRSRRRLLTVFAFVDLALLLYLIYSLIVLFTHLN